MNGAKGHREPPEGVLAGENVPVENDRQAVNESLLDEAVGLLKGHPAYTGRSDDELREIAREKLQE